LHLGRRWAAPDISETIARCNRSKILQGSTQKEEFGVTVHMSGIASRASDETTADKLMGEHWLQQLVWQRDDEPNFRVKCGSKVTVTVKHEKGTAKVSCEEPCKFGSGPLTKGLKELKRAVKNYVTIERLPYGFQHSIVVAAAIARVMGMGDIGEVSFSNLKNDAKIFGDIKSHIEVLVSRKQEEQTHDYKDNKSFLEAVAATCDTKLIVGGTAILEDSTYFVVINDTEEAKKALRTVQAYDAPVKSADGVLGVKGADAGEVYLLGARSLYSLVPRRFQLRVDPTSGENTFRMYLQDAEDDVRHTLYSALLTDAVISRRPVINAGEKHSKSSTTAFMKFLVTAVGNRVRDKIKDYGHEGDHGGQLVYHPDSLIAGASEGKDMWRTGTYRFATLVTHQDGVKVRIADDKGRESSVLPTEWKGRFTPKMSKKTPNSESSQNTEGMVYILVEPTDEEGKGTGIGIDISALFKMHMDRNVTVDVICSVMDFSMKPRSIPVGYVPIRPIRYKIKPVDGNAKLTALVMCVEGWILPTYAWDIDHGIFAQAGFGGIMLKGSSAWYCITPHDRLYRLGGTEWHTQTMSVGTNYVERDGEHVRSIERGVLIKIAKFTNAVVTLSTFLDDDEADKFLRRCKDRISKKRQEGEVFKDVQCSHTVCGHCNTKRQGRKSSRASCAGEGNRHLFPCPSCLQSVNSKKWTSVKKQVSETWPSNILGSKGTESTKEYADAFGQHVRLIRASSGKERYSKVRAFVRDLCEIGGIAKATESFRTLLEARGTAAPAEGES
jgi:hypothetical protein